MKNNNITSPKNFNKNSVNSIIKMVEETLFRSLPILNKINIADEFYIDQEVVILDPNWEHLLPIYELFLQLISSDICDIKLLKTYIIPSFIRKILNLFDSEEQRERKYLKNILHRLYAILVSKRKMIRDCITNCLYTLIHENIKFNGVSELLDILTSIVSGYIIPLKEEHILFFNTVIIPLYKVHTYHLYNEQLFNCSMIFISKDPSLAIPLINGLLRYWPFTNSAKGIIFLDKLYEIVMICDIIIIEPLIPKLFKHLLKCIMGFHLHIAVKALSFFENDNFILLIKAYRSIIYPIIVPSITYKIDTYMYKILNESFDALKIILNEIDNILYDKTIGDAKIIPTINVEEKWKILLQYAIHTKKIEESNNDI